jgi:hypothetical protein
LLLYSSPAGADATTPPGVCVGSGKWQNAGFTETSTAHNQGDTITVPRKDTVEWSGSEKGFALGSTGPRRDIAGEVKLALPIGDVTVDSWGGSSVRYANTGTHSYDIPAVFKGITMKLSGEHRENGTVTCSGFVYVKIKGSGLASPVGLASVGLLAVSGVGLAFAGMARFTKVAPAFEDINPG